MCDAKVNTVMFDGCRAHAVSPFKGRRSSLVFFTSGSWENGDDETMSAYGLSSFTRPTKERLEELAEHVPPARGYPLARDAPPPLVAQWPRPSSKATAADFVADVVDQTEGHRSTVRRWMNGEREPANAPEKYVLRTWERFDETPRKVFLTTKDKGPKWDSVVHRDTLDLFSN